MGRRLVQQKEEKNENAGIQFYGTVGIIIMICGIFSFLLLCLVYMLPQDYEKYNIPLFFGIWFVISLVVFLLGIILIILCKKSKRFQVWAEKDVLSYAEHLLNKELQAEEKKHKRRNDRTGRNS